MADLEAASALSAALATISAAALISQSVFILTLCSKSGLGKYILSFKFSSLLAINSYMSFNELSLPGKSVAGMQSIRLAYGDS